MQGQKKNIALFHETCYYISVTFLSLFFQASGRKIPYEICEPRTGDVASSYATCQRAEKELGWKAKRNLMEMCKCLFFFWQHRILEQYVNSVIVNSTMVKIAMVTTGFFTCCTHCIATNDRVLDRSRHLELAVQESLRLLRRRQRWCGALNRRIL